MTDKPPRSRQSLLLPVAITVGLLAVIAAALWGFSRVLLRLEPRVATATALLMAVAVVAVIAFAATRKHVGNGALLSVVAGVFGAGMLLSGLALLVGQETGGEGPEQVTLALEAPKGAAASGFDLTSLSGPSDAPFTLAFNNQDPGVQHNVVIASGDGPDAENLFEGQILTGPEEYDYSVTALPEGDYHYFCEIHPTTMTGTLTVAPGLEPGGGGPGGGGAPTTEITAENLAFDVQTIDLVAGEKTTITFQNNDANTPHNISIYEDESAAKSLFTGDLVTGVKSIEYDIPALDAGSYYFHCDVHPDTMFGTVTVAEGGGGGPPPSGGPSGGGEPPPSGSGAPPGGGGGTTVTASGLAFDVSDLSLPAGQPSTITFDNEDEGIPHNIAIYTDSSASDSLFTGEVVTGVATKEYDVPPLDAGSYYFHCDIHPTMSGTVTVG